jgi:hypothetical protein
VEYSSAIPNNSQAQSGDIGAPFEALDDDLLDVHLCAGAVDSTAESKQEIL